MRKLKTIIFKGDVPRNTDEEVWNDVNTMNLFFTVDYSSQNNEIVNIASATLRLYKLPQVWIEMVYFCPIFYLILRVYFRNIMRRLKKTVKIRNI